MTKYKIEISDNQGHSGEFPISFDFMTTAEMFVIFLQSCFDGPSRLKYRVVPRVFVEVLV